VVQAITTRMFVTMTGRVGQKVVLETASPPVRALRRPGRGLPRGLHLRPRHLQATSDLDAISDLFEEGLDSLIAPS